jgi:hypothetical protein
MDLQLIESRVERITESGCWIWMGPTNPYGYGRMFIREIGRHISMHRLAWQIANGPIPPKLFVCHRCDIPACVNPSHLFLGTHRDNMLDCMRKGRHPGTANQPCPLGESRRDKIRAAKIANPLLTLAQLAKMFGCSSTTAQKSCASLSLEIRRRYRFLSEQDVLTIRYRALVLNENRSALGREFGLSDNYVFNILSGKRWKRLPFPSAAQVPA